MVNVIHLIFLMENGGAENMLVDLVNEQVNHANVSIIVVNNQYNKLLISRISPKVQIVYLERKKGSLNPFVLFRIWNLLFKLKADVIHCHQQNLIQLLPFWRKKAVVTIHDVGVETKYLHKYKKVFAISSAVRQDLICRANIYSTVVLNGIQIANIKYKDTNKLTERLSYKIIQISRLLHEKKGQHLAIEAIHKLNKKEFSNIQLYFIGKGPSLNYLKDLVKLYNLEENIFFLGEKDREWIYKNLNQFDLLLQPSLYEGFGLTIIEGLAAGLPVIASSIDGPAEILKDMPAGFLVDTCNNDDLVQTIEKVIKIIKSNKIQELCSQSRELVNQKYSINQTAINYIENYKLFNPSLAVLK
jgi:glycosyltransferase involved in cell wall biosynthesis